MDIDDLNGGHNRDAKALLRRYADGTATSRERRLFEQWYTHLHREDHTKLTEAELATAEQIMLTMLLNKIQPAKVRRINYAFRASIAAAVLLLLLGTWFFVYRSVSPKHATIAAAVDIAPGKNTATIRLPNGKVIQLSDAKTGVVIDAAALTYSDGTAVGASLAATPATGSMMLTASTPRGGTYQFTLDDGTKVWLNADSRLEFASAFTGAERKVKLAGEAFFEVAKDASHPFIVESNGQEVKVLGTQFNINTYTDEPATKTTLLEGSVLVKLTNSAKTVLLKPGEQSAAEASSLSAIAADAATIEQAVAWKNGDFIFDSDIQTIMKQVARWYDVEVVYKGVTPTEEFGGKVSRSKSIKQVLKILESTNSIHFEIKGRRITVMK